MIRFTHLVQNYNTTEYSIFNHPYLIFKVSINNLYNLYLSILTKYPRLFFNQVNTPHDIKIYQQRNIFSQLAKP